MFEQKSTRQIDLHLPTGWNRCTTEELEAIAAAIITEQQRVDRYHHFDWSRVKLGVVLSINSLSIVRQNRTKHDGGSVPVASSDGEQWMVRRPQDSEPWPITTGQLVALTECLAWIDDEKANKVIFQFPYPELTLRRTDGNRGSGSKLSTLNSQLSTLHGPPPLLDGYTWNEYRLLTDWMQAYMRNANAKNAEVAAEAQREFLAILFKPAGEKMFNVQCSMIFRP